MEVEQLKYFIMVAQYKHFTFAAEQLCISQSALSKQIRALESELGVPLLDRCGRSIHITSAGQDFLIYAKEVVDGYNKLKQHLNLYRATTEGHISVGFIPVTGQYGINSALSSFNKNHPEITIEIIEDKVEHIVNLMDDGVIDFAFLHTTHLPNNDYKVIPLVEDVMVLAVNKDHHLADRSEIDLAEIGNEHLIMPERVRGLHNQAKVPLNIQFNNVSTQTVISFVTEKVGIAVLLKKAVESYKNENIVMIPLHDPIKSTLALVFPHGKKLSPSATMLRGYLANWFKKLEQAKGSIAETRI